MQHEGGAITNGDNDFSVRLPDDLGPAPLRVTIGDEWVAERPLGIDTEPAQLENEAATYEAGQADTSFEFTGLANGLKEDIELEGPSSPNIFHFELSASSGVTPELTEEGAIQFRTEGGKGKVVATMPAPVMSDSAPAPQFSHAVHYSLTAAPQGTWRLTVEADREWLSAPDRAWPVRIDPTIAKLSPVLDCIYSGTTTSEGSASCGAAGWPYLGGLYRPTLTSDEWNRSAIRFDLSSIPKDASITAATVGLYSPAAALNTAGVELREATRPWTNALNWKRATASTFWTKEGGDYNSAGAEVLTASRGSAAGWWLFSEGLTRVAQEWLVLPSSNQGLIIKLIDDHNRECVGSSCTQRYALFNSSAGPVAERPYFAVTYVPPASADSKVSSPKSGTRSAKRFKLAASWTHAGVTGVTFQYNGIEGWTSIPESKVTDAKGQTVKWPVATEGAHESPAVYWNAIEGTANRSTKNIRAVLVGSPTGEGYTPGVEVQLNRDLGGVKDATAPVGPGSVDLLTGNFNVSRTDVAIPGFGSALEFSRSSSSRESNAEEFGLLGPGWTPGATVEAGNSIWSSLREESFTEEWEEESVPYHYLLLKTVEGAEVSVEKSESGGYVMPPELTGWSLVAEGPKFVLSDLEGNRTTFENPGGGSDFVPTAVSQAGGPGNKSQLVYGVVASRKRLKLVIAPSAPGVECPPSEVALERVGCHALKFTYLPESNWGAKLGNSERLAGITYYAATSPTTMGHWDVAQYGYAGAEGRLVAEWDPRITPELKETYSYEAAGQLHTVTPPGQEPWTMEYGVLEGETANGRLIAVKRASLVASPSTAQTTIAYGVPLSGASAPNDMSPTTVGKWGQRDIPLDATAIFPPDQVPSSPPSSYSRAAIYYMDSEGQSVNTATPSGAGTSAPSISTMETDEFGNVVREMTAQNRVRVMAAGTESERAELAKQLESKRLYTADGTELLEEWGPTHQIRLESGTTTQGRLYKNLEYDKKEMPVGLTPDPHLPTGETTGALVGGSLLDQRVIKTKYNWTLRRPIETIVDPGGTGLNLRSTTVYDENGLPIEIRQPSNPEGGKAGTTKTIYYKATGSGECEGSPQYANLPCKITPAAQPGTGGLPQLVVRKFLAYNPLGQPLEATESPGGEAGNTRKTISVYDNAGRRLSQKIEGGGAVVPKVKVLYSGTTGLPTKQEFVCEGSCTDTQATTTTYDGLGRIEKYEDADGNVAKTTYDLDGRPVTTSDGKGSQTMTYDPTSGLLVKLEDSAAGTFTASYDADGNLVERGLPDGLTAKTTFNEAGESTHLTYTKASSCGASCTWFDEGIERSIYGQDLSQTGTLASQIYTYDKAGRLTSAAETPKGGSCTTRSYTYDEDSNRKSLTTRAPGVGGACSFSGGTPQNYEYDAADRLLGTGLTYDSWGRILNLPASFAGGKELKTSYFSTDMVAEQIQNGVSNTFQLDGALRQRQRLQGGGLEGVEVFHYDNGSDSPAWTQRGSLWTRNIVGIGGELCAVQESSSGTTLRLTNIHGDVVGSASLSPAVTSLLATDRFDEFGNPVAGSAGRYGWLGGKQRPTELASGTIQMGVRSYVPQIGRFLSRDPVSGGSANPYDYAEADPINGFDLGGTCALKKCKRLMAAARKAALAQVRGRRNGGAARLLIEGIFNPTAPITTRDCVPAGDVGIKATVWNKVMGGDCVPKLNLGPVNSSAEVAADAAAGIGWCIALNTFPFTSAYTGAFSPLEGAAFCGPQSDHSWDYVHAAGSRVPSNRSTW